MKKSYYQKIFNPCIFLFTAGFLGIISLLILSISLDTLRSITHLSFLYQLIKAFYTISLVTTILAVLLFLVLSYFEVFFRLKQDSLTNLWKSIYQTLTVRVFLTQSERSESVTTIEQVKVTRYNPINQSFNRAIRKAIVDIREDEIVLLIRVPKTQQATKILKEMETLISEEISNRNPDYYFSHPERKQKWVYFIGTKRK